VKGLASERTALAWRRSIAGLLGLSLLVGRGALTHWPPLAGAAAVCVTGAVVVGSVLAGHRRFSALRHQAPRPLRTRVIALLTGAVLVIALLGFALLLAR
jgi:uncharacterized membrane protein YidH (DUF202 family)